MMMMMMLVVMMIPGDKWQSKCGYKNMKCTKKLGDFAD